jgi:hypothetical protein
MNRDNCCAISPIIALAQTLFVLSVPYQKPQKMLGFFGLFASPTAARDYGGDV